MKYFIIIAYIYYLSKFPFAFLQLTIIKEALGAAQHDSEKVSLLSLEADLNQLIQLTQESLDATQSKASESTRNTSQANTRNEVCNDLDNEYSLFMVRYLIEAFLTVIFHKKIPHGGYTILLS